MYTRLPTFKASTRSSSRNMRRLLSAANSPLFSLAWATPPATRCVPMLQNSDADGDWLTKTSRFSNVSTSTAVSLSPETTWLSTTVPTLTMLSEKDLARPLCTRPPEGSSPTCAPDPAISKHRLTIACSLIGIGEIVLLPLDVLKIKRQTNPEAFRGRGLFKIISDEGMGLYRGAGWTAARNAPGSFAVRFPDRSSCCDGWRVI